MSITEKIYEKLEGLWHSLLAFRPHLWRIYWVYLLYKAFDHFRPYKVPEGFTLTVRNELFSYWYFFIKREFDHASWVPRFKAASSPFCIDIGVNFGIFCRYLRHLNPGVTVAGFEPMEDAYQHLVNNNICNGGVHPVALGERESKAEFHYLPTGYTELTHAFREGAEVREVRVCPLDSFNLPAPFLVKIDVEGMEDSVVRGGLKTMRAAQVIIAEINSPENLKEITALLPEHQPMRLTLTDYLFCKGK